MEILLALAAAVSYGVSDFAGGVLTPRAHVFVVLLLSQLVSFALLWWSWRYRRTPSRGRGGLGSRDEHPKAEEQRVGSHAVIPADT